MSPKTANIITITVTLVISLILLNVFEQQLQPMTHIKGTLGVLVLALIVHSFHMFLRKLLVVKCPKCKSILSYQHTTRPTQESTQEIVQTIESVSGYICSQCGYERVEYISD